LGIEMLLTEFLRKYRLEHDIRPSTAEHYGWVIHSLERYAGSQLATHHLSDVLVNAWLAHLQDLGQSPFTRKNRRTSALVLWRAAVEDGLAEPPRKVRPVKTPDPPKHVWSPEEISALIAACSTLTGRFRGTRISRSAYFATLIQAAYDTGLRRCDLHAIRCDEIGHGPIVLDQIKTSRSVVVQLRQSTVEAVQEFIAGDTRALVWPLWSDRRGTFASTFRRVVAAAGLSGHFGRIRKTSGTEVERESPGLGWVYLGHSNPDTARRWYLNQARCYGGRVPLPPDLPLQGDRHADQAKAQKVS
jgi:integrase